MQTVINWLHKFDIPVRRCGYPQNHIKITHDLREFLEGHLLGDGSLPETGNPTTYYAHGDKNEEYVEWLSRKLSNFGIEQSGSINKRVYRGRVYYAYKSKGYIEFSGMRERWYINKKKKVPDDFEISPTSILFWYVGDGTYSVADKKYPNAKCCKIGTSLGNVVRIKCQLEDIGIICSITSQGLSILSETRNDFFEYILRSKNTPPRCYSYKFPKEFQGAFNTQGDNKRVSTQRSLLPPLPPRSSPPENFGAVGEVSN